MTRNNPLDHIDPAVASILDGAEKKQRLRRLPRDEQRKARQDAARERAIYDLPHGVKGAVEEIARQEGLSPSSVVTLLLADGVRRYRAGRISFYGLKRPSRSPRYEWTLAGEALQTVLRRGLESGEDASGGSGTFWP